MKKLALEDMTKDELINLINICYPHIGQRDLLKVRWESLNRLADDIMRAAQVKLDANVGGGVENIKQFQNASEEFDEGMRIADKAGEVYEVMMGYKSFDE